MLEMVKLFVNLAWVNVLPVAMVQLVILVQKLILSVQIVIALFRYKQVVSQFLIKFKMSRLLVLMTLL